MYTTRAASSRPFNILLSSHQCGRKCARVCSPQLMLYIILYVYIIYRGSFTYIIVIVIIIILSCTAVAQSIAVRIDQLMRIRSTRIDTIIECDRVCVCHTIIRPLKHPRRRRDYIVSFQISILAITLVLHTRTRFADCAFI